MRGQNQILSLHLERVIPIVQFNLPQLIIDSEDQSSNNPITQDIHQLNNIYGLLIREVFFHRMKDTTEIVEVQNLAT